jgi:SAM-dependent methyltransferase
MIKLAGHYAEPRLVVLYDIENARGADTDFYVRLTEELDARTIIDVGCGTGRLTLELVGDGRQVIGVDPAPAMLAIARQKPGAEQVLWIEGDSSALGAREADLAIMTGNVAQVFLDDAGWAANLRHIHTTLRPSGHLAFESRNPDDRAWERWNPEATYEQFDSPNGPMEAWMEVVSVEDGRVHIVGHNIFKATGEVVLASEELRFRSLAELTASLVDAGFTIEHVYGDWNRGPFVSTSRIMVIVARRN